MKSLMSFIMVNRVLTLVTTLVLFTNNLSGREYGYPDDWPGEPFDDNGYKAVEFYADSEFLTAPENIVNLLFDTTNYDTTDFQSYYSALSFAQSKKHKYRMYNGEKVFLQELFNMDTVKNFKVIIPDTTLIPLMMKCRISDISFWTFKADSSKTGARAYVQLWGPESYLPRLLEYIKQNYSEFAFINKPKSRDFFYRDWQNNNQKQHDSQGRED